MEPAFSAPAIAIILSILVALSFLFSCSETSIIGLSKIRLRHMIAKGIKRAEHIQHLVTNLDKFIVAILVGNNFVNIAISAIVSAVFINRFGYDWGIILATFTTTIFILVFCEITPKILAIKHTEKIALFISPAMELFLKLFRHVIDVFINASNLILRIFGMETPKRSPLITEEELRLMIEVGKEEGVLSDEERKMLHRIFEFGDTRLSEVMVPKDKIVSVNINATSEELMNIFVEEGHARLPVFSGSVDNIVGVVYARDLLYILRDKGIFLLQDILHPVYFAQGSMQVNALLRKFQVDKIQIAIVVDKDKKTQGLVTLEDLIEEIVGEIEEEHSDLCREYK